MSETDRRRADTPVRQAPSLSTDSSGRRFEPSLIAWGFALNLAWELAHSPLYEDHTAGLIYVAWTRLHCTIGDVIILLATFWATAAVFRSWRWPATHGGRGTVLFVTLGILYTMWSEWFNTVVRQAWTYAPAMPRLLGVGLSPLAQWLVVPAILAYLMRLEARRSVPSGS